MKKKKKYIKIFALTILFMISISVNAEVKAETNYYDDNGVLYRLVFDDTQLKDFVKRDFALYYNEKDMQNNDIAKLTAVSKSGTYTYSYGFTKEKQLNIMIYETSEEWQQNNNEKYIAIVLADYVAGNYNSVRPRINENIKGIRDKSGKYYFIMSRYEYNNGYSIDMLNFNKNDSSVSHIESINNYGEGGDTSLLIAVDKEGNITRKNDLWEYNSNLMREILNNTSANLIYSNLDIYDHETNEIVRPKDEIRKPIRVEKDIKIFENNENQVSFKFYNLKKEDKIKIIRKDSSGNYSENDIIERKIESDIEETKYYLINDEKIKENKIYNIIVYDGKDKELYNATYIHKIKNYTLDDKSEEKTKLINLENYKINSKLANIIKNVFIIANESYLGKLLFLVFTITIITIIRKKV